MLKQVKSGSEMGWNKMFLHSLKEVNGEASAYKISRRWWRRHSSVLKVDRERFQQETNEENLSSIMDHALTDSFHCLDQFSAPQSLKRKRVNP